MSHPNAIVEKCAHFIEIHYSHISDIITYIEIRSSNLKNYKKEEYLNVLIRYAVFTLLEYLLFPLQSCFGVHTWAKRKRIIEKGEGGL